MHINDLPNEVLIHIFSSFDSETILVVENVCIRWQEVALSPAVWRKICLVFSMRNYQYITERILPRVADKLKSVKLQYFRHYSLIRMPLTDLCHSLTYLEISVSHVEYYVFEDLKCWPQLEYLSFRNSIITLKGDDPNHNHMIDLPFENLTKLQTIILSRFTLSTTSFNNMLLCLNLGVIDFEKIKNIPSIYLESLINSRIYVLREFCCYGDTLNEDIIKMISKCKRLYLLHIMNCKSLFDTSLLHLSNLIEMKSLKLRHAVFSANALYSFFYQNKFEKMKFLSLSRCLHVSWQVIEAIKINAPKLEELSLYHCPLIYHPNFDRSELNLFLPIKLLLD